MAYHIQKKIKKNSKKIQRNSRRLTDLVGFLQKQIRLSTQQIYLTYRQSGEIIDGVGFNTLVMDSSPGTPQLPFHIYSLSPICQQTVFPVAAKYLSYTGYDFTNISSYQQGSGQSGNTVYDIANLKLRQAYQNYFKIDLCLWQNASKKTTYKLYLVKFNDVDFDPFNGETTTTDTVVQNKRIMLFKRHFLRSQVTNPVVQETLGKDLRNKGYFTILWQKDYVMGEQLSTHDELGYKHVKIFREVNRVLSYEDDVDPKTETNYQNADEVLIQDMRSTLNTHPQTEQNTFFIITANCSEDVQRTYDININLKYTIPAQILQS